MADDKGKRLWGGRFGEGPHQLMERINASIGVDRRLYLQDIRGSQAHAAMLARQEVLSARDAEKIIAGLEQVKQEIEAGKMAWSDSLEDIHTHVEVRLKEIIGEAAGRLHTARSRNDQVATDLRLWVMDAGRDLDSALIGFQRALVEVAEEHAATIMPGYTHLQRAQPVLLAHHLLAYVEMTWRDRARLADCLGRAAVLPLGAAALAGTSFDLDPASVADELGFGAVFNNSLDAVSDRDFAAEFLFVLSLVQVHLSRLAEELVLWSSQEFGFISLSDAFATGSSIMPQKKNPDAAELVRGKTGRVVGDLISLLTVLKGLPLAYNKDLQEDKEPVFDAYDTVTDCLLVMAPMISTMHVNAQRMELAVGHGFLNATELADYLAAQGVPFRVAHEVAGKAVRLAEDRVCTLEELGEEDHARLCEGLEVELGVGLKQALDPVRAVNRRISPGGTARQNVEAALKEARKRLWPEGSA
ncbi:MAG: argininosuccinate lyase [Desulfarculaceae bacterium]|nr:argininosuccinate lyase [Desulfarculaceae bacterium]MCF8073459.1 argininosuccinate lyase [Desulfarculaceae bacterium]MCF8100394.1 argininosuccinate lyase [Desulfarculaceae bacterium]MCF8115870.1 argininosuccinate lyase [Desulfarculaceae bacterium]